MHYFDPLSFILSRRKDLAISNIEILLWAHTKFLKDVVFSRDPLVDSLGESINFSVWPSESTKVDGALGGDTHVARVIRMRTPRHIWN